MAGEVERIRVIDFEIPNHWQRATFRQLLNDGSLELVQDGNHGGAYPKPEEFAPTGIPIITGADLYSGVIDLRGCKFLKPASAARLRIGYAKQGDVLLTHKGTMGKTSIVPSLPWPYIILNPQLTLYRVSRNGRLHARFLKFFFDSKPFQAFLERISGISTISTLSLTTQKSLEIPLPPLAEQKAIAAVLGALDDKIELNRRMNATLEAMARALFQSWFVDFDPVRAKIDGGQPVGIDSGTAALWPEHLEDSPLGHIPKGWEVRTIESVCKTVTRGVTPEYREGTGRFIINQRVNRGPFLDWTSLKELTQGLEVPLERLAKRWDVLVNCLGEGTLGRTHLYKGESDLYAIDQHMSICRAEHRSGGAYIYQVLSGADGQAKIESLKTGSTGMTMFNISKLRAFDMVWPPASILAAYFKIVEPLCLQVANNDQESRTLATLRDTLLPKLLSGELQPTQN